MKSNGDVTIVLEDDRYEEQPEMLRMFLLGLAVSVLYINNQLYINHIVSH